MKKIFNLKVMNKITKLLGILALMASTSLWSCTGDTGPEGPKGDQGVPGKDGVNGTNGTNGKDGAKGEDGNANVQSFSFTAKTADWVEVDFAAVGTGATTKWGVNTFSNAAVTTEKEVRVYHKSNDDRREPLPIWNSIDMNRSTELVQHVTESGKVHIKYRFETQLFGGQTTLKPSTDLNFEIILITKTFSQALKNQGVDLNDYNAVMAAASAL
jgi:hypothetical protein